MLQVYRGKQFWNAPFCNLWAHFLYIFSKKTKDTWELSHEGELWDVFFEFKTGSVVLISYVIPVIIGCIIAIDSTAHTCIGTRVYLNFTHHNSFTTFLLLKLHLLPGIKSKNPILGNSLHIVTYQLTLNMLNCLKDYKIHIHIFNGILDVARPKQMKLTLEQQYMFIVLD